VKRSSQLQARKFPRKIWYPIILVLEAREKFSTLNLEGMKLIVSIFGRRHAYSPDILRKPSK
jgi:hypothetical protein